MRTTRWSPRVAAAGALLAALLIGHVAAFETNSMSASAAPVAYAEIAKTSIELKVQGCKGCRIQPVQNKNESLTWSGRSRKVRDGSVSFTVPTRRTDHMAFLVYAPFDELAQGGIPMVIAVGFKAREPRSKITPRYAAKARQVSGCWRGTTGSTVRRTLVVNKVKIKDSLISEDPITVAAGYFTRTLPARPYWHRTRKAQLHASEPVICR